MTVSSEALITVGRIKTVFGVKGWLKVDSYTQPIENILEYNEWMIETSSGVLKQVCDATKLRGKDIVVHFEGLDDREEARQFTQCLIKVPTNTLPKLNDSEFYWHQLQGLKVYQLDELSENCLIGTVDHLLETGANDVLVVKSEQITEKSAKKNSAKKSKVTDILIPYLPDQVIKKVDIEKGLIIVDWYYD